MIKSLNWAAKNFTKTRDYALLTADAQEVYEVSDCFNADWERADFDGGMNARLIWCPGNGRARIARFIEHTFLHDWDHSHRIDLSDRGIIKEMESHGRRDYGSLALEPEVKTTAPDDSKPNHKKGR